MLRRGLWLAAWGLVVCLGPARADIVTGLMASYPLDGNANDVSGNGNHGSVVGSLVATTDRFGTPNAAYEFNGLNSYISIPNSASLSSPTTAITQAAWVEIYGNSKVGSLTFVPITMKSLDSANAFMYRMMASPTYFGAAFNNWNTSLSAGATLPPTEWHHITTVFNGSTIRFYFDGVFVNSQALVLTIAPDTRPLTLGADFAGVLEIYWGKMDDVRFYSRALSDADVLELYTDGPTDVARSPSMANFAIGHSLPNPTSGETRVEFVLGASESIQLNVYDVAGRRVRNVMSGALPAGPHVANWDGRTDSGQQAPSGVYFFRLQAGRHALSSRVVRVR